MITQVQVHWIEVHKSLLTWSAETVYGTTSVTVKDLMKFADQLARAGADCRSRLDAVKRIVEGH
ncbi:hypothetical protein [Rhizobium sp. Root482]|uniref:hypothetical protein n=1 Tax=Rhizobium sp. Root482 TaxID=1736543 RepID=UPI0006F1F61D|nr:hypothetical protein [Rhizobium sp. Root482]KQY26212.1 hypothetical protein ASD31_19605 [Rhizobium sp. Root482]